MSDVFSMLRKGRLEYAIKREIDRQTVVFSDEAIAHLVDVAARHIDTHFGDDDARGFAAEQAEKTLNPVITSMAEAHSGAVSHEFCQSYIRSPAVIAFPWTAATPD